MSKKGQPKPPKQGAGRFAMIPACAFYDSRLSAEAVATLGCIATYLNNHETPWWPIGQGEIAAKRGILRTSVNRTIKKLVDLGYLEQRAQTRKAGGKIESMYFMNMHVHVPSEHRRVLIEDAPDEEQSEPEPSEDVALESDVALGAHPLSPYGDIPVAVGAHPRRPTATSNIRMTDHLTHHHTEMASPSLDYEPEPETVMEPTWPEINDWIKTAMGREALATEQPQRRYQKSLHRQLCMAWASEHPVQWELWREGRLAERERDRGRVKESLDVVRSGPP